MLQLAARHKGSFSVCKSCWPVCHWLQDIQAPPSVLCANQRFNKCCCSYVLRRNCITGPGYVLAVLGMLYRMGYDFSTTTGWGGCFTHWPPATTAGCYCHSAHAQLLIVRCLWCLLLAVIEGMDVVYKVEAIGSGGGTPSKKVVIADSGELYEST